MPWSENPQTSVTVPTDKDVNNAADLRDWITIGEDLPPELAQYLTTAIILHTGNYMPDSSVMQIKYWGMGARNGVFYNFAYIENYRNVAGDNRFVALNLFYVDESYTVQSQYGAKDNVDGVNVDTFNTIYGTLRDAIYPLAQDMQAAGYLAPGWYWYGGTYSEPTIRIDATGMITVVGHLGTTLTTLNTTTAKDIVLGTLPVAYRPPKAYVRTAQTSVGAMLRVDVLANGQILARSVTTALTAQTTPSAGNASYISLDMSWPAPNRAY